MSCRCQVGSAIGSHLPALRQGFPWLLPTVLPVPASGKRLLTSAPLLAFVSANTHDYWYRLTFVFFLLGQLGIRENQIIFTAWVLATYLRDLKWIFCMWFSAQQVDMVGGSSTFIFLVWKFAAWIMCEWQVWGKEDLACSAVAHEVGCVFLLLVLKKRRENCFHRRGCGILKPFIFLPQKVTHTYNYTYIFKRTLAGERGGLLMCIFSGLPVFNVFWGCLDAVPVVHAMLSPSVLSHTMEGHNREGLCLWSQPCQQQLNRLDWNSPHLSCLLITLCLQREGFLKCLKQSRSHVRDFSGGFSANKTQCWHFQGNHSSCTRGLLRDSSNGHCEKQLLERKGSRQSISCLSCWGQGEEALGKASPWRDKANGGRKGRWLLKYFLGQGWRDSDVWYKPALK